MLKPKYKITSEILATIIAFLIGWFSHAYFNKEKTSIIQTQETNSVSNYNVEIQPHEKKNENQDLFTEGKVEKSENRQEDNIIKFKLSLIDKIEQATNRGDLDLAKKLLQEAEVKNDQSQRYYEQKGRLLFLNNENEEAKKSLEECLKRYPNSKSCNIDLGNLVLQEGTKDEQESVIENCSRKFPKDLQCKNLLGNLRMQQGRYTEAIQIYLQLINENGSFGVRFSEEILYWNLGLSYENAKKTNEAIDAYNKACHEGMTQACNKAEELLHQN